MRDSERFITVLNTSERDKCFPKLSDNRSVMVRRKDRTQRTGVCKLALWLANRKNDKGDSSVVYRMEDDGGGKFK